MTKVKICGIQTAADALAAVQYGADALGFVFAPSRRRVTQDQAREIIRKLPPFVTRVGVFVNTPREEVRQIADTCGLDVLQFHGDEPPEWCLGWTGFRVVKAVSVAAAGDLEEIGRYQVDAVLLDAKVPGQRGGTGLTFNWELAARTNAQVPRLILAGGLTPDNIADAIQLVKPYAVDVSSGVEKIDGYKDPIKIMQFMQQIRRADHDLA